MTELRTEGGGRSLTRRADKVVNKQQRVDVTGETVRGADGWWVYAFEDLVGKFSFNGASKRLEKTLPQKCCAANMVLLAMICRREPS